MHNHIGKTSAALGCFLLSFFLFCSVLTYGKVQNDSTSRKFVVVLDAGHGGKDRGTSWNGFIEKDIALNIVLKLGKILEKHRDIKVLYTRKSDVFVTLKGRAEKANQAKADLFVSVHCNANDNHRPHGAETFVLGIYRNKDNLKIAMKENSVIYLEKDYKATYDGFDPESPASYIGMTLMQETYLNQSILLADYIQKQFGNTLHRYDRGVKKAGFLVIRETYMPSVLIETGFLSNRAEGKYLNSSHGQQEMAMAISKGVLNYKNALNLDAINVEDLSTDEIKKKATKKNIEFRVQIAAGSKPLETAPYNFNGLKNIERKKEGELYKYYYGETPDYVKIQELQQDAIEKGYLKAYVVAFKNGKKISVDEALKNMAK